ncbi:MAG: bifunctional phosphopantothenoylcysteine decarboxylase/phosphopantothenate--cysteine ligase CoaBC [Hyphomicrobiales bacterium]|nr:bifunctional phosphopantothenoylcysteine decarboxylase/phosphopantothenate--cysteine ligase CoaBC [Hyphomicrobiales bacterium]
MSLNEKRICLVIGGGVAAYKALDLIRRLREHGAAVQPVMTKSAHEFVTPLSVAALAEKPVYSELFDLKAETEIGHIRLSREADAIVIAPASANLLARMAHGLADDLAAAMLLAADKPILAAPAMNWRMWAHPATQRNIATLSSDGVRFVGPTKGAMACNEHGVGRMAEPADIVAAVEAMLTGSGAALAGRRVLVTAGPTFEPIDPVRFIGNRSSGKQGYAIAAAARDLGAETTLIAGPSSLPDPPGVVVRHVTTAAEMLRAVNDALPADIAVFAAAVADWRSEVAASEKLKKGKTGAASLRLVENPDILATVAHRTAQRPRLVIGFAAETENVIEHAQRKRQTKGCDWIVANDVSPGAGVFGGDANTVHLITEDGVQSWPRLSKADVAAELMRCAALTLNGVG